MSVDPIARAKELLATVRHAAVATVNEDGSPHNSPVFFMYAPDLSRVYWGSHAASRHSRNIERTGQLFMVVYDAIQPGGLYLRGEGGHQLQLAEPEFDAGLLAHNAARARAGKDPIDKVYYKTGPQHMYAADIVQLWVNGEERGQDGYVTRDYRVEISAGDLLRG